VGEGDALRRGIDGKPAQRADVVGWSRVAGDNPREIVHIEGVVELFGVGILVNENGERAVELYLETGFLENLPSRAVDWILARFEKPAGHVPIAAIRLDGSLAEQDSVSVDDERAGAGL
jgi:hypothetical protein